MGWGSVIVDCTWCRSSLRPRPSSGCWDQGSPRTIASDDCLGRALDWLYAHDPTTLFAGIAQRARRALGISARQVHVDTTSFAVTGEYESDLDAHTLAVTYGYSRDHRADLKQWMLALATTRHGDVPLFCQALDGNASDTVSLVAAVEALAAQLRAAAQDDEDEAPLFVA